MVEEVRVALFDIVTAISDAVDLVNPALVNHHFRVAYIASSLANELGLGREEKDRLLIAGMLHDIGALELRERIESLDFEFQNPYRHAEMGFLLLRDSEFLSDEAWLVRFHHVMWLDGEGSEFKGHKVPKGSHILHLSDRVAVLVKGGTDVLGQVDFVLRVVEEHKGSMFVPEFVDALKSLARKESFWLDIASPKLKEIVTRRRPASELELDLKALLTIGRILSRVIDFRSPFTATHTAGVASTAEALARAVGFSSREQVLMRLAGYLHDLGKLAVPAEILEKPGKLTQEEFNVIRSHTYHTYRTLENIPGLELVNIWGALHHERLDGTGYPFHLAADDLPLGSRIMAVADVFTALTEDRPYRKGMSPKEALRILEQMAKEGGLDPEVVLALKRNAEEIDQIRRQWQEQATKEFKALREGWAEGRPS